MNPISARFLFVLALLAGAPSPATQDDPKKKEAEEREAKAKALYEEGVALMDAGKLREAQTKLRELRDRYRICKAYWDHAEDVTERLVECGSRIAVEELRVQKQYKRAHQDSWHGIEFAPPDTWRGIPPFQKYARSEDSSEVNYAGQTIRIARYTSRFLESLHLMVFKQYAPKDLKEVEDKVAADLESRYKGLQEDSSGALKGRFHAASRKVYHDADGDRLAMYSFFADRKGFALVGIWRSRPDEGFVVSFSGAKKREVKEEDWKEALRVFDETAKTFWIWPSAQLSELRVRLKYGVQLPDWKQMTTKGYVLEYNTRDDYAKQVGDQMDRIMNFYKATIPTTKAIPLCRIKLFDTEEDFQYYGQAPGAAAYWSPAQEEICAYRFTGKELKLDSKESLTITEGKNPEEETFHVMYHEGFHQYMHFWMGRDRNIYVPSWINEGMGDYYFGGTWSQKGGKMSLEIRPNWWRLETIQQAIRENKHVPLERIFRYTQAQYYTDPGLCYSEGWAICYFILTSDKARKKGYDRIVLKLLNELKGSENWEKATTAALAGVDLKAMEAEWKEFVMTLKPEKR
ncbi:MAG: hypothetical protein HYY17_10455 [Planctomycetes bacterium]|nr:hypothetical protein [Planctomycetota bacterium]